MVKARFLRRALCGATRREVLCGYAVEGHAGFGKHGTDIVCAAISAIAQTTLLGLQDILGQHEVQVSIQSGDMQVLISPQKALGEGPKALFRALELGLRAIAASHPQSVSIDDSEH